MVVAVSARSLHTSALSGAIRQPGDITFGLARHQGRITNAGTLCGRTAEPWVFTNFSFNLTYSLGPRLRWLVSPTLRATNNHAVNRAASEVHGSHVRGEMHGLHFERKVFLL